MSDKTSRNTPDNPGEPLDPARETGKDNVRDAVEDKLHAGIPDATARDRATSTGRGARPGVPGVGDGETGEGRGLLGGAGLASAIILIVIAVLVYLLLR